VPWREAIVNDVVRLCKTRSIKIPSTSAILANVGSYLRHCPSTAEAIAIALAVGVFDVKAKMTGKGVLLPKLMESDIVCEALAVGKKLRHVESLRQSTASQEKVDQEEFQVVGDIRGSENVLHSTLSLCTRMSELMAKDATVEFSHAGRL
jgi:hypothetical protein